jgi:hypothetical protein
MTILFLEANKHKRQDLGETMKRNNVVWVSLLRCCLRDAEQVPNGFTSASSMCELVARKPERKEFSIRAAEQRASFLFF